jgi:hypothetical protein
MSLLTLLFVILNSDIHDILTSTILDASDYVPILVHPVYRLPDTVPQIDAWSEREQTGWQAGSATRKFQVAIARQV